MTPAHVFETPHQSPQRPLWTPTDDEWVKVLRLPDYGRRRLPLAGDSVQVPLFTEASAG